MKKGHKMNTLYSLFILLSLLVTDLWVFVFLQGSEEGFFVALGGLKQGILLVIENIIIIIFILFQNKLKKKLQAQYWIKVINVIMLLITPVFVLAMVQLIIGEGTWTIQTGYIIKNLIIYYALYIIVLMIFRKACVSISLYTIILVFASLADYFITLFRGNAFLLMDIFSIETATQVAGNYVFKFPAKSGICLLGVLIFLLYQLVFQSLELGKRSKKSYAIRCGILVAVLLALMVNWNRIADEDVDQWDIASDYKNSGYLYKLACETRYLKIQKIKQYSIDRVKEIAEETEKEFEKESKTYNSEDNVTEKIVPKNVIVIMNESLADFEEFDNLKASEAILPGIRSLQENTKKGYVYVPSFGAGTSDTEYEMLTGNSKQFLPTGGIAYQLYCKNPEYGLASTFKQEGYSTTAVHPGSVSSWNRSNVYSWMDFDTFYNKENWGDDLKYYRWYARDSSAYKRLKVLYKNKENENQFMFCVTIQNHGGYDPANNEKFVPDVKLSYDQEYPDAEIYLSLAKKSDTTFMKLLDFFSDVDEPTMIVMFGDHWPSLDRGFFSELMGQDFDSLDLIQKQETYKTPYVIWTNYPSESSEEDMSINYFGSYILQQTGLEMTTYNKFLLQLKEKLPIIGIDAVRDAEGNWYAMDALPEEYEELINKYKILQYNNVADHTHRVDSIFELTEQ